MFYLFIDETTKDGYIIGASDSEEAESLLFDDILDPNETDAYVEQEYTTEAEARKVAEENGYEFYDYNDDEDEDDDDDD